MARYHQRWRVIQFLRRVPRHWTELIPRWKAGLHPGLSLLFLRFVAWIFLERGRAKWPSKERSMGKEGRTTPISSRLFYSSCFFTAALTDAGNHDLEIPLRKDRERRKKGRSLVLRSLSVFFILLHTLIFSLYVYFFSTPLFLRYFFDRDVRTGLNSRGEFNRESSVIDEGRLHGTRSNNEFAARRMPAANRRSSECQGQNWEVSSIYLPGWMMLEQPRHWMALEYFYKICLNLEKPSSIVFKWGI